MLQREVGRQAFDVIPVDLIVSPRHQRRTDEADDDQQLRAGLPAAEIAHFPDVFVKCALQERSVPGGGAMSNWSSMST